MRLSNIPINMLSNIQSRILMKTDSDFNTNSIIETKETIEEITLQKVANFNRGRAIIKDGQSSKKIFNSSAFYFWKSTFILFNKKYQ